MPTQDNRGAGRYDRRIDILEPTDGFTDSNEPQTVYVPKFRNFPACRLETSGESENLKDRVVEGKIRTEWEIRYIQNIGIKTNWRIKDIHDGRTYKIVSPTSEIGRRQGMKLVTELIE